MGIQYNSRTGFCPIDMIFVIWFIIKMIYSFVWKNNTFIQIYPYFERSNKPLTKNARFTLSSYFGDEI